MMYFPVTLYIVCRHLHYKTISSQMHPRPPQQVVWVTDHSLSSFTLVFNTDTAVFWPVKPHSSLLMSPDFWSLVCDPSSFSFLFRLIENTSKFLPSKHKFCHRFMSSDPVSHHLHSYHCIIGRCLWALVGTAVGLPLLLVLDWSCVLSWLIDYLENSGTKGLKMTVKRSVFSVGVSTK